MPVLTRIQQNCQDVSCDRAPLGPGPALNAASAKGQTEYMDADRSASSGSSFQGINLPDPSDRNPNVALNKYVTANRPEVILGVLLVFIIAIIALVCWVRFDAKARKRFKKYWAAFTARVSSIMKRGNGGPPQLPVSGPSSPATTQSGVSTQAKPMTMTTSERPTLDRAPSGSQLSVMKTNQIAALPVLLSRP